MGFLRRALFFCIVLFLFTACAGRASRDISFDSKKFVVAAFTSLLGRVEESGCRFDLAGGAALLSKKLEELRGKEGEPVFVLSGGDILFPSAFLPEGERRKFVGRAERVSSFLKDKIDVSVPGEADLAFGCFVVKRSGIRWVLTNARYSGGDFFKRSVLLKRGGVRLFVIGLLDPSLGRGVCRGLELTDPAEALKSVLLKVDKDVFPVVLAHGSREWVDRLRAGVKRSVLFIGGHDGVLTTRPVLGKACAYIEGSSFGRDLLLLRVTFGGSFYGFFDDTRNLELSKQLSEIEEDIEYRKKLIVFSSGVERDVLFRQLKKLEGMRSKMIALSKELREPVPGAAGLSFSIVSVVNEGSDLKVTRGGMCE